MRRDAWYWEWLLERFCLKSQWRHRIWILLHRWRHKQLLKSGKL